MLWLLWLHLIPLCWAASIETNSRIVGGVPVDIGSVPYLVNLRIGGNFMCGGSLVTPQHVITAAHCVKGVGASRVQVVAGITKLSETGVRSGVEKVFTPKAYNARTLNIDVAVLKLKSSISGPKVSTIELCNTSFKAGDLIKVSGWGQITERNKAVSMQVRSVDVALIPRKTCMSQYKLRGTITSTMFCASVPGVKDSCEGDSGGPAVYQGQLCGIVSWGVGCARKNSPGVYTNVKTVRSFIDKALGM